MPALLARLRSSGVPLAICSNNNEFWYQRQKVKVGLDKYFDDDKVVLSCHERVEKNNNTLKMFRAASERLGLAEAECVFIDDRMENINRALECKMTGILFPSGSSDGARYLDALLQKLGL
jgi:HAD superfamily hydrolase (TIGR01509 family)